MKISPDVSPISTIGQCHVVSPLPLSTVHGDGLVNFVSEEARLRYNAVIGQGDARPDVFFKLAGPRRDIFFTADEACGAIVTCGGLCPGLNNVIRSIFNQLWFGYGVRKVYGVRYGFRGLHPDSGAEPFLLTQAFVESIHRSGGTVLGSSRGPGDPAVMVEFLRQKGINMLFCVGGDGTQRGAHSIAEEVKRRGLPIAVVGVPKTIDNDIPYVQRTFGFVTAIEEARRVIDCAHVEARGVPNGIALVKLMGRHAGYIAASATVASQDVNFTLVPEVPFELEGKNGFLAALKDRVQLRGHAVVVVAEGAGQDLIQGEDAGEDASHNAILNDIGRFLKERIQAYFEAESVPATLKYLDPSYAIRSVPAAAEDSVLCDQFARHAVHAAMAGKTDMLVGYWNAEYIHVPISLALRERKQMDTEGDLWRTVLAATGQAPHFRAEPNQTEPRQPVTAGCG